MRGNALLSTTAALLIVGAALPVLPAEAAGKRRKPPANVLEASVRVDVETGLLDPSGSWLVDVGGRSVLVTTVMTSKGKLSGVAWYDGSEISVSGRTRRTRRSQTLSLTGVSRRNNRPDARLSIRGTVDGDGEFTGTGRLTRKSGLAAKTGVSKRADAVSGTTPGAGTGATVGLYLDVEPKDGSATGAALVGQLLIRTPSLDAEFFETLDLKGTARGTNGNDAVRLTGRRRGARVTLVGEHNGTRFTGFLTGAAGVQVLRRSPVSFDTGNAPADQGTALGSDSTRVTIPADGRLTSDLDLDTSSGPRLHIPAGTKVVTPTGQLLGGDFVYTITDDGTTRGVSDPLPDTATLTISVSPVDSNDDPGTDEAADSTKGRGVPAQFVLEGLDEWEVAEVIYEVEDELTPPIGSNELSGAFDRSAGVVQPRVAAAKQLRDAWLGFFNLEEGEIDEVFIPTDSTGRWETGFSTAPPPPPAPAPVARDVQIPGDDTSEFPKVKSVSVAALGTGQILATARVTGLGLGESATAVSLPGASRYDIELVGEGGNRIVRVRSGALNAFSIRVVYCNADGSIGVVISEPPTNPIGELVAVGPYDGRIDVTITGQGGLDVVAEDVFELSEAVGDDGVVEQRRFEPTPGGGFRASIRVIGYTEAVTALANRLGAAWAVDLSGHRQLTIRRIAGLGAILAVCGLSDNTLNFFDALTLTLLGKVKLPGRPGAVALGPSGRRAYVTTPKRLICVDADALAIARSVPVRNLLPNVIVDPTGRYVYLANSKGEIQAFDTRTLFKLWAVGGFAKEFVGPISLAHGGRYAYFTQPTTSPAQICGVDLLGAAHTAGSRTRFNWALPCAPFAGAQAYAVSHDGLRGVVSVPAFGQPGAGSLTILDTTTWAPIRTLPGLTEPIQVAWTEDDGLVVAPAFNQDALIVMDPDTGESTTVGGIDGANGLAVFRTADGIDLAYTGGFEDDTLHFRDLLKNGGQPPLVGENVSESVQLGFQPGPMSAGRQVRFGLRYSFKR